MVFSDTVYFSIKSQHLRSITPDSSECVRLDVFAVVPTEVSEVDVCVCVRVVLLFLFNVLLCITFMCENEWMCVGLSDSDAC